MSQGGNSPVFSAMRPDFKSGALLNNSVSTSPQANPMVSGAGPYKGPFTNTAPGMMGGMGGSATPSFAPIAPAAMEQPASSQGSPVAMADQPPTQSGMMQGMGGPANSMQPFSQQNLPPQLQQLMAQRQAFGGKGGMPGGSPMQQGGFMKSPMQQQSSPQAQGLAALMNSQQKSQPSINSLQ